MACTRALLKQMRDNFNPGRNANPNLTLILALTHVRLRKCMSRARVYAHPGVCPVADYENNHWLSE